jgi:YidC/Oxa1 family membrane protein insertase
VDITYNLILPLLQYIASVCHSYGWAIIFTTLLIRILVWPLVSGSTKSMQRMSALQPKLKELKERYEGDPAEFQRKTMEFYQKNKINPMGGCLPMLVQLPILIALYSTFMGPPFQDKPIPVKVTLAKPADKSNVKVVVTPTSGANSPYVSPEGKLAKFAVQPGDQTLIWGSNASGAVTDEPNVIDFHVIPLEGEAPANFEPKWIIQSDTNRATIDLFTGHASFPREGEIVVQALLPGGSKIDVPLKVEGKAPESGGWNPFGGGGPSGAEAFRTKTEQSTDTATFELNGKQVTVAVVPGPSTIVTGAHNVQFQLKPISGDLGEFQPTWHIVKDDNAATIDAKGHAVFPKPGEVVVAADIPGIAAKERFYFVESLGKIVKGMDMFKPANFDVLGMLIAFAVTMWLSQKLMVQPTANLDPDQAAIQKQTQQTMPIMLTAMFFFFALPAGVYLYLVVSNVMQTLQTWIIYRSPAPALVDVTDDSSSSGTAKPSGGIIDVKATSSEDQDADKKGLDGKKKKKK